MSAAPLPPVIHASSQISPASNPVVPREIWHAKVSQLYSDYTSVVIGIVAILGLVNWFAYAHKHYKGPRIDLGDLETPGLEVRIEC